MKSKFLAIMLGAVLVLGACGGAKTVKKDEGAATTPGATTTVDAEAIVQKNCIGCHGGNIELKGGVGPALANIGSKLSESEIHDIIINGAGGGAMPGGLIQGEEADAVAKWLSEKK